jgi:precorrin-6y C5,15-methyltransferase (decarboxylating) CbiE subunit
MAVKPARVLVIGCGPGAAEYVTPAARQAVARAEVLVGSRRLLDLFPDHAGAKVAIDGRIHAAPEEIAAMAREGKTVAVLVGGDPGLFSIARNVLAAAGRENCEVVPGISSVQAAFARLALDWADARLVSAHGRTPATAIDDLGRSDKIAVLAGGRQGLAWAAAAAAGLRQSHAAWLCEDLTLATEHVRRVTPEELARANASSLAIVLLVRNSLLSGPSS